MNYKSLFPSNYLSAEELEDGDKVFTIKSVEMEPVGQEKQEKPVLNFDGSEKGLVLNKTNANVIASLYGSNIEDWVGKAITLYATEVQYQGKTTMGIRVRAKKPASKLDGILKK